jgi:hypothetical protein
VGWGWDLSVGSISLSLVRLLVTCDLIKIP